MKAVIGTRRGIGNKKQIIGPYNVNKNNKDSVDLEEAKIPNTLRQIADDDEKWRQILRGLNSDFYHQMVSTSQIENYISEKMNMDLSPIFNQYLRDIRIPVFEYIYNGGILKYRWNDVVSNFNMPIELTYDNNSKWLFPNKEWQDLKLENDNFKIDENYYVFSKELVK